MSGTSQSTKSDYDIIKENYQFIRESNSYESSSSSSIQSETNRAPGSVDTFEDRLSKRYYDSLHKEYCIADLSRYEVSCDKWPPNQKHSISVLLLCFSRFSFVCTCLLVTFFLNWISICHFQFVCWLNVDGFNVSHPVSYFNLDGWCGFKVENKRWSAEWSGTNNLRRKQMSEWFAKNKKRSRANKLWAQFSVRREWKA